MSIVLIWFQFKKITLEDTFYFGIKLIRMEILFEWKMFLSVKLRTPCGATRPKSFGWLRGIYTGLILGFRPANERRRYFVTRSLIGWAQALYEPKPSRVALVHEISWTRAALKGLEFDQQNNTMEASGDQPSFYSLYKNINSVEVISGRRKMALRTVRGVSEQRNTHLKETEENIKTADILYCTRHFIYRKISNIRRTKSPNLNVSRLVVQLSLPNPMKPRC